MKKNITNASSAIAAVQPMLPKIKSLAAATENNRRVSDEVIQELIDSGLFTVVQPKIFGGLDAGFEALVGVTSEIASACGSTGWVYGVLAGHSWLLNLFPQKIQEEVFSKPNVLLATVFRLSAEVVEVDGGYRMTSAVGRFCSGVDFADYVIVGSAVKKAGGELEPRFFVVSMKDVEVIDDWFTMGMKGTGSRSIKINDVFIPDYCSCSLSDMLKGTAPGADFHDGPLFRLPFSDVAPFSIVGAPLGMARGALDITMGSLKGKLTNASPEQQIPYQQTLARCGNSSAALDGAMLLLRESASRLDNLTHDNVGDFVAKRGEIPRNWAYAVKTACALVNDLYSVAGGSSIYDGSEIQRAWRDINAASQHVAFGWDNAMTRFAKLAIGLEANDFSLPNKK